MKGKHQPYIIHSILEMCVLSFQGSPHRLRYWFDENWATEKSPLFAEFSSSKESIQYRTKKETLLQSMGIPGYLALYRPYIWQVPPFQVPEIPIDWMIPGDTPVTKPTTSNSFAWGNQLISCSCGCRGPFSHERLSKHGLFGALVHVPGMPPVGKIHQG